VRAKERESAIRGGSDFGYDYLALAHKRHHKMMEPFIMVFPSGSIKDIRFEHEGEEFMFILSGSRVRGNPRWPQQDLDPLARRQRLLRLPDPPRGRSLRGESRALVVIYRSPVAAS